jgi:TonB family protein
MIGEILGGRYRLDRHDDTDNVGTVYLGTDLDANETSYAVNVLRPEIGRFSEALALLRAEVRVTRMLRHPHIARVYSLNADRRGVFLVSEYLEGRTLKAELADIGTGLPLNKARRLVADMVAALAYAHDLDVVHGDLQPANVFITASGRAKLLHFGLARAAGTRNGRFDPRRFDGQTLAYAVPEMLQGCAADPRDDVYSLGCTIYTMLSGTHPFELRSAVEARDLALTMAPLPMLSTDQNSALARALTFERDQRTPSVTALLTGLGWDVDLPAAPERFTIAAAGPALAPAIAEPPSPAATVRSPATAVSSAAAAVLSPAAAVSPPPSDPRPARTAPRRILMPTLIALSLSLVAVGIWMVLHRENDVIVTTRSRPAARNPLPAATATAPAASTAVATNITDPPALAHAVSGPQTAGTTAVADKKIIASVPIPILRPLSKAAAAMADNDNCPYPRDALAQGLTGTVSLLVYVAADGKPEKTKMDRTSGSEALDQAAIRCVEQYARFPAPPEESSASGYWGRIRFKWSFGT